MPFLDFSQPQPVPPPLPPDPLADHSITEAEYESRIRRYFGSAKPTHKASAVLINGIIAATRNPSADDYELHIAFDFTTDNTDIELQWHRRDPMHLVDYSIPLFELIMNEYAPTEIEFSKAVKAINNPGGGGGTLDLPDIVFRLKKTKNNPGETYFGNLSNVWP